MKGLRPPFKAPAPPDDLRAIIERMWDQVSLQRAPAVSD
jgi:hypothetical protein